MSTERNSTDPLDFMKNLWGNMGFALPGMVTPTLDVAELDRRVTDLKAVEGWLKMNLNMLQMTIQGLEVQRATLAAMEAMSQSMRHAQAAAGASDTEPPSPTPTPSPMADFNPTALWPWNLVKPTEPAPPAAEDEAKTKARATRSPRTRKE